MKRLLSINLDLSSGVWQILPPPFSFFSVWEGARWHHQSLAGRRTHLRFPNKRLTEISTGPKDTLISPGEKKKVFLFFLCWGNESSFVFPRMAFREGNPLILDKKEKTRRRKRKLFFHSFCGTVKRFTREFVPLFKATLTQPTLGFPFLLPRWRRIFMNIKQGGKPGRSFSPFPQNVLLCVRYILVKKRRGENWLISNYISRKKEGKGDTESVFSPDCQFSTSFSYGKLRTHSIFPSKPECYLRFHWTLGNPFLPSCTNKHNTTTGRGEFSCESTHPTPPCQQPLLCHISLGRFFLPPTTLPFPFPRKWRERQ